MFLPFSVKRISVLSVLKSVVTGRLQGECYISVSNKLSRDTSKSVPQVIGVLVISHTY